VRLQREKRFSGGLRPYAQTHLPTLPHPDLKGKSGNGPWADVLMQNDAYVGRLLDAVDELGE